MCFDVYLKLPFDMHVDISPYRASVEFVFSSMDATNSAKQSKKLLRCIIRVPQLTQLALMVTRCYEGFHPRF